MKILAVANPIAGGVDKGEFVGHFESQMKKFGIVSEIFYTTGNNSDGYNLKKSLESFHPDRVISIGGDGTTLFTACSLINSQIPFGIIPLGSANGMAAELAVDPDPNVALADILQSKMTCPLDLILVDEKYYCIHIGDVGINAEIVEGFSRDESRGMTSYIKHFLERILHSELLEYQIEADGKMYEGTGYMIAIANSRKYGTGIVLNYDGNPTDGWFELVILKEINTKILVKAGLTWFNEELAKGDNIEVIQCKEATVSLNQTQTLQLDGEIIGEFSNFKSRILASSVRVVTTKNNPFLSRK